MQTTPETDRARTVGARTLNPARTVWLLLAWLAGCYAPEVPEGVACDPARPYCPSGQSCVQVDGEFTCASEDPSSDASGPLDRDGDGVPDLVDNCPSVKNPSQSNFDDDWFGDACDPCPPYADEPPIDRDGDGVSDQCDPDPASPGDHIVAFDSFEHGLAGWNADGAWTQQSDGVTVDLSAGAHASLTMPLADATRRNVTASFTATVLRNLPQPAGAGTVVQYDPSGDAGIDCELQVMPVAQTRLSLVDTSSDHTLSYQLASFGPGADYTTSITGSAGTYRCRSGATDTTSASSYAAGSPEVGVRVVGARVTYHWVLVTSNAPP